MVIQKQGNREIGTALHSERTNIFTWDRCMPSFTPSSWTQIRFSQIPTLVVQSAQALYRRLAQTINFKNKPLMEKIHPSIKRTQTFEKTTRLSLKSLQIPREISHLVKKNHVFYAKKSTPLLEATTSLSLTPTQNKRVINIRHNKEITCQCKNNLSFRTQVREYTFWIYAHGTIQVVPSERFFHMCAKSVLHHFHIYHCIQNCR